jgi:hypothetical protein
MKEGIRFSFGLSQLFWVTAIVGLVAAFIVASEDPKIRFFTICFLPPTLLGVISRMILNLSNRASGIITYLSTVVFSASLFACGSQYSTFIEPAQGQIDRFGWGVVFASEFFGAFLVLFGGWISVYFFLCVSSSYDLIVKGKF